jgi:hypothetical protein
MVTLWVLENSGFAALMPAEPASGGVGAPGLAAEPSLAVQSAAQQCWNLRSA